MLDEEIEPPKISFPKKNKVTKPVTTVKVSQDGEFQDDISSNNEAPSVDLLQRIRELEAELDKAVDNANISIDKNKSQEVITSFENRIKELETQIEQANKTISDLNEKELKQLGKPITMNGVLGLANDATEQDVTNAIFDTLLARVSDERVAILIEKARTAGIELKHEDKNTFRQRIEGTLKAAKKIFNTK